MTLDLDALSGVPLFRGIAPADLRVLADALRPHRVPAGHVLFAADEVADDFHVLSDGIVSVVEREGEQFRLRPIAPLGELGAITGQRRYFTAVAAVECELHSLPVAELHALLGRHPTLGLALHANLLGMTVRKVRRDARRIAEMRENLITTQKAMKRMRQALLDSEDTPLHAAFFEELDSLIEQNRKGHYLTEVRDAIPTTVRADGGDAVTVIALSNEWLHLRIAGAAPARGTEWSGVLELASGAIPVSGTVEEVDGDEVHVYLDELIEGFAVTLEDHLTRLQMLDVVL